MNYLRAAKNWGIVAANAAVYFPVSMVGGTVSRAATQWAMRNWCRSCCDQVGIRRTLINPEILERTGQCILVANHLSSLDILVLGSFLGRDYRWMAKRELFKVPLSGWHLYLAGHIPVDRNATDKTELYRRIHQVVTEGASVLFFAEGTRSRNGQLKPFKIGAFSTAVRENLPVVPLVIDGTYDLMLPGAKDLAIRKDKSCTVTVLDPIMPAAGPTGPLDAEAAEADLRERSRRLRHQTYRLFLDQLYPGRSYVEGEEDAEGRLGAERARHDGEPGVRAAR